MANIKPKPTNGKILKKYIPDFLEKISETIKDEKERAVFFGKEGKVLGEATGIVGFVQIPKSVKMFEMKGGFHTHLWDPLLSRRDLFGLLLLRKFEVIGSCFPSPRMDLYEINSTSKRIWALIFWFFTFFPYPYKKRFRSLFIFKKFVNCWTLSENGEWI